MSHSRATRLLAFARKLQRAGTFLELLELVNEEAGEATGYRHSWLLVAETEEAEELRMLEASGARTDLFWEVAPVLKVKGDRFLEDLVQSDQPVVIEDARSDPRTNKDIVQRLENRTIINIPLRLVDKPLGFFGVGSFGDKEGCRAPTAGELEHLIGMASQITVAASRIRLLAERANAEKERQELERRLLQAQKLESLGMLAGGVAHDFNNLLTVIIGSASLAAEQVQDQGALAEMHSVLDAATRARDITQKLLAMSRSQELDLKLLDVNSQLRQLLKLGRRLLPETITIDLIEGAKLPLVEADPVQLDQVFMNLLINARDAMPDGGHLSIETELVLVTGKYAEAHPGATPGRYVLVTLTDTGTGMAKDVQERVFEPFFTTKGPRAGTGLGLAVAYGVMRQHRGMLHCYSEVGVGTSFKVYLPAAERLAAAIGSKIQRPAPRGRENVLIAEDDEMVRAVAVRILERGGYRVTAVEDGAAAVGLLAEREFDLVLLDVVMPGMTCREVIERVLALRPSSRILLSSGYTAGVNVATLIGEHQLTLLRKPYDPDQLLRAVRDQLDVPE